MKKIIYFLITMLFFTTIFGQPNFDQLIKKVKLTKSAGDKEKIINNFLLKAKDSGIPLIENKVVHFIYHGKANKVNLASDINSWNDSSIVFNKIEDTDFFYYSMELNKKARIDYKLIIDDGKWILDPLNPHTIKGGFGNNSELAMPEYIQPKEIIYNKKISHGGLINKKIYSTTTDKKYNISIYLPPNYNENEVKKYPSVYFQDGAEYIELGSTVNVLDNLIHKKMIRPTIAIFVTPTNRNVEYAFEDRNKYAEFFAIELVPYIDEQFVTFSKPEEKIVIGDSYGANISALICYYYPNVFGKCGLHSAAFQPNSFEVIDLFSNVKKSEVDFYAVWGTYEKIVDNMMKEFIEISQSKNFKIKYNKYPEGHSWGLWRATTDEILKYFIPFKEQ
ncbi:MAG: alpha/beta hydrolase-fold protein [Candidatus Marinimicrobia bacterium]|nr:alpha/beta hydrolase-fold protein [Candidatus Neomarinimicrobiota bacterium]